MNLSQLKQPTRFVMDNIAKALIHLMEEEEIDRISICAVIEEAQVSRNSFYRHFKDKDDILRYYIMSETEEWLEKENVNFLTKESLQTYIVQLLSHLYQYRDVVSLLLRDQKLYLLEEEFDRRFEKVLSSTYDTWHIAFLSGGFYKLFCHWAKTGYQKTPEEIAAYMKSL